MFPEFCLRMGNVDTKVNYRKAVVQLTSKAETVQPDNEIFWEQFWSENVNSVQDMFTLVPASEIRTLRENSPSNFVTLCSKTVEKLVHIVDNGCHTQVEHQTVLNCIRLLTRIVPYIFEDSEWRTFFWTKTIVYHKEGSDQDPITYSLAQALLHSICDLLFCPDFTVAPMRRRGPDKVETLASIDSCEYIWEAGVGFASSPPRNQQFDSNRTELLKLLLTCMSETMYHEHFEKIADSPNKWIAYVTSSENRHALPMFTSLLNCVCAYDPVGYGVPYNHLLFTDSLEPLVEVALQILIVTLDYDTNTGSQNVNNTTPDNLFINYLSRIHRDDDFEFVLSGITKLLNNPLLQTYLPNSTKKVQFYQEMLIFFWKFCDYNKKFLYFVLKSSDVLDVLVPILYYLNDSRADQSRVGVMHIGVFILLLLSGERNFGVRLNKPYTATVPMDIPVFSGTHADLLVVVFHKIITTGHQRLQPLFDCLLTVLVNVSPYLKTLSMVSSTKLLHLLEAFSTPWFLFSLPSNHYLVFFLLELFNNIIQYQFDGNSNLVYTIIRKRHVFHSLLNLPSDHGAISKTLNKRSTTTTTTNNSTYYRNDDENCSTVPLKSRNTNNHHHHMMTSGTNADLVDHFGPEVPMEGSHPAQPAEPGTLKATLPDMPGIGQITERESAHPVQRTEICDELAEQCDDSDISNAFRAFSFDNNHRMENETSGTTKVETKLEAPQPKQTINDDVASGSRNNDESSTNPWIPTGEWVHSWKSKLPLQTIMRMLQVLVPQVEKICIDKGLTDENEILKFLQHGTLVGLLPVPHPILIRKYQANCGTTSWFRTYMWGVIYLRNVDPPIWYDTEVKLFEIQRV